MVQPFDAGRLETAGDSYPVADGGKTQPARWDFFASQTGVLAYSGGGRNAITWFDRAAKPLGTVGQVGPTSQPAISPEGGRVAFQP